jgi:hypothetical protein
MIGCRTTAFRGKILSIDLYEKTKQRKNIKSKASVPSESQAAEVIDDTIGRKIVVRGVGNLFSHDVKAKFDSYGEIVDFVYNNKKGKAIITYK